MSDEAKQDVARPFTVREDMAAAWTAHRIASPHPLGDPRYSNGLLDRLVEVADLHIAEAEARGAAKGWKRGYRDGHLQACPGSCTHGVMRNPFSAAKAPR